MTSLQTPRAVAPSTRLMRAVVALLLTFAFSWLGGRAHAAPEAHILRVDPRSSLVDGAPVLTTVIEIVQSKRLSDITGPCATLTGDGYLDCIANGLQKPKALWAPFDFPSDNAVLTVRVDNSDIPAQLISSQKWGESKGEPGVGTAWLILIDAASSMDGRLDDAQSIARAFVDKMGPNDIVDVMYFNDRDVVLDSKWTADKNRAGEAIAAVPKVYPSQGRVRQLFTIIKKAATDGFKELGNAGSGGVSPPMHQAMLVLSNGVAGADASSTGAGALALSQYMSKGRFPEENEALPKVPVPVISIWFPAKGGLQETASNAQEFMQSLPNIDIGGAYFIVRSGQASRGGSIVSAVHERFDRMNIVKWKVSCVASTLTQSFNLFFTNVDPQIAPDATFDNVPVGIDPSTWPLDIDVKATEKAAKKDEEVYPGGTLRVIGNFCWGGDKNRAELYMVPKNQAAPTTLEGGSIEDAKKAQRTLIEAGMRGKALSAGDSVVEFEIPDTTKFLVKKGEKFEARFIVYDNQARRTSAVTAEKILTVSAAEKPLPYLLIGGATFGGVVLLILVITMFRSGGRSKRGAAPPPPRPIVAGSAPGPAAPAPMPVAPLPPQPAVVNQATLTGTQGIFTILPGMEMRAGRDGAICQILLNEPRVSGGHATLKLEGGQLLVRDDNSNNGTHIAGQRIPASVWSPVPHGAQLRFGPVEFNVRLE